MRDGKCWLKLNNFIFVSFCYLGSKVNIWYSNIELVVK